MHSATRTCLLAAALFLTSTASLEAYDSRVVYYYYSPYVYDGCGAVAVYRAWLVSAPVVVAPVIATPAPVVSTNPRWFAPQTPAPPSGEAATPPRSEGPQVSESRLPTAQTPPPKFYDAYYVAASSQPVQRETCSVAFWNLADRPLQLHIAGRSHIIA